MALVTEQHSLREPPEHHSLREPPQFPLQVTRALRGCSSLPEILPLSANTSNETTAAMHRLPPRLPPLPNQSGGRLKIKALSFLPPLLLEPGTIEARSLQASPERNPRFVQVS